MSNSHQQPSQILIVSVIIFSSIFSLAGCHVKVGYPSVESLTTDSAETLEIPSKPQLQQLVTTTLLDFNEALESEDFTHFHETIATPFKYQTSPEYFDHCFKSLLEEKITMAGINKDSVHFTVTPDLDDNGLLNLKGLSTVLPNAVSFELKYLCEGDDWKLISINLKFWEIEALPTSNQMPPPETSI